MLSLFTGTPGSGKSYHATERIDRCLKQGINVICTYPIKTNYKHRGLFVYVPYYDLTPEFLINFCMEHHDLKCNPEKCQTFIVIDEAHLLFNTRGFDMKERQKWCEFLALHRHYWYDIMLLTQNDRAIDRQVRGLVEFNYKHRKLTSYGLKGFLLVVLLHKKYVAVRYWYVLNEKCDAYFFNTKKKIFKLYDTMAIISPQKKIMMVHLPLLISFRPRLNGMPSERKKVNKVRDCENCFFYDDYTLTSCCHKECDDPSLDISECDDLIEAAEAAFDDYLAECTAYYSELCSVRAQSRK